METQTNPILVAKQTQIASGNLSTQWAVVDGLITYAGKIFVPSDSALIPTILAAVHDMGHEGIQNTLRRVREHFFVFTKTSSSWLIMFAVVEPASGIKQNIYIQPGYCNHWKFLVKFGLIYLWTLWKVCQR